MTDSRLGITADLFLDEATEIAVLPIASFPGEPALRIAAGDGRDRLHLHLGHDPGEVVGNADRLTAALAEIRTAAAAALGQTDPVGPVVLTATSYDPAEGSPDPVPDLAEGDHFAGMPA